MNSNERISPCESGERCGGLPGWRIFTIATPLSACQQPTGRDNALHGSCLTVARIDSPFRGWAVPFLFSQCHLFQNIPYQYVDVRFHRRGVFAPVYCRTINYGSDCLLGPLNVSGRDIPASLPPSQSADANVMNGSKQRKGARNENYILSCGYSN